MKQVEYKGKDGATYVVRVVEGFVYREYAVATKDLRAYIQALTELADQVETEYVRLAPDLRLAIHGDDITVEYHSRITKAWRQSVEPGTRELIAAYRAGLERGQK